MATATSSTTFWESEIYLPIAWKFKAAPTLTTERNSVTFAWLQSRARPFASRVGNRKPSGAFPHAGHWGALSLHVGKWWMVTTPGPAQCRIIIQLISGQPIPEDEAEYGCQARHYDRFACYNQDVAISGFQSGLDLTTHVSRDLSSAMAQLMFSIVSILLLSRFGVCENSNPVVVTTHGTVIGIHDTASGVQKFLGIPFAEPLVGPYRLRQSVPLKRPFDNFQADESGYSGYSSRVQENGSEDCLSRDILSRI